VQLEPKLIDVLLPERPEGAVLVLHGGANREGRPMVSPTQISVLRVVPIARRIARASKRRLAVFRLINSRRGWDTSHTPAQDARWALDRIRDVLGGELPTCLVGHSLGGRAALLCADRPEVRGVVALAPWVQATDIPTGEVDASVLIVHGSRDRVALPERSAALARSLGSRAAVSYVTVAGGKHGMLRHHRAFDGLAIEFALATLLDEHGDGPIGRVLAGERWIEL
jgi:pimeloyl-ACP methyl ester carboxylesterase